MKLSGTSILGIAIAGVLSLNSVAFGQVKYSTGSSKAKKILVYKPETALPGIRPTLTNLEAPNVGGTSYRSYLLGVKKEVRNRFPVSHEKSGNAGSPELAEPVYLDSFVLKYRLLAINGNDTLIDTIEFFRDQGVPLDNTLSISGDDYLVCGINSRFYFHNLKSGSDPREAEITVVNFESLADSGGIATDFPFDPKVVYDPVEDRFVITFLTGRSPSNSGLILAFSTSGNPKEPWNVYLLSGNPYDNGLWSDYPAMALSNSELFYTINLLIPGSDWKVLFKQSVIWQIDKYDGYGGADSLDHRLIGDISLDGRYLRNLAVVHGADSLPGSEMYFLSNRNFDVENDTVFLVRLKNTLEKPAVVEILPLKGNQVYGVPPNGRQKNSDPDDPADGFDTNDARILGAFRKKNEIQMVGNSVDPGTGRAAIYHGIISGLNTVPILKATILGDQEIDYGYPNIAFTGGGDCISSVICFDHTSPVEFAGVSAIAFHRDATGIESYSPRMVLKKGENYVNRHSGTYERWGDYTGIQRHPTENGVVYAAGFYGTKDTLIAATWLSKLRQCDCMSLAVAEKVLSDYNLCAGQLEARVENAFSQVSIAWNGGTQSGISLPVNLCDYTYRVEATDGHGCRAISADTVTKAMPETRIYPNPTSGDVNVYFTLEDRTEISVEIISLDGKLAYKLVDNRSAEAGRNLLSFSVSSLQAGIYFVRLKKGNDVFQTEKFVVE